MSCVALGAYEQELIVPIRPYAVCTFAHWLDNNLATSVPLFTLVWTVAAYRIRCLRWHRHLAILEGWMEELRLGIYRFRITDPKHPYEDHLQASGILW